MQVIRVAVTSVGEYHEPRVQNDLNSDVSTIQECESTITLTG